VIDAEVRAAIARGRARVLVELRLPEDAPSRDAAAQERAIATVQQAVLARLSQAPPQHVHRYVSVPLLSLEIGADALPVLEAMGDLVVRVRSDRLRAPSTPQ
jgi:hypothetical protein